MEKCDECKAGKEHGCGGQCDICKHYVCCWDTPNPYDFCDGCQYDPTKCDDCFSGTTLGNPEGEPRT